MKKEKLILSFIAVLFGLLVAGGIFYLLQAAKTVPSNITKIDPVVSPTPTLIPSVFLILDRPKNEEVVTDKVLTISGRSAGNAAIVIVTDSFEDVIMPALNGDFSATVKIDNGQNIIDVTAIAPNGESVTIKKTVTYSQEEF
ncbi:MAG: hypothetical protein A3C22_02835 [Candidatus Levybacteria bacterium RIFCSPHIGHO2_02_FULL_37_10]|nr:MAG: hypothetical protein A3C22_02835 [Candidatus Levybacteria bacterium RIFCSPHIGHO2_02_FULL_37_10]